MRYILATLILASALAQGFFQQEVKPDKESATVIARLKRNGVELRVNQIQLQRLNTTIKLDESINGFVIDPKNLMRTLAISLSQNGQGTSVGPTQLRLRDGTRIGPILSGNQQFMSGLANAETPDGFDFGEYWFAIPDDKNLADIFPVTVIHRTTNKKQEAVLFEVNDLTP